ncbi:disks large-associated protein 5 [Nephila pilipes]|uniref:Disks large-associated protein 5 n=1 Tax=Nephila pilipes TaxID=299642 RepID=A0A8X6U1D8_NEPPI|nr:disks large-associated protein 5 [Nephila pilipes]
MESRNSLKRKSGVNKSEQPGIPYFRGLLDSNIEELKDYCKTWEEISSNENVPEEVCDEIRATIGLTNLLLHQKLKQFGDLINDSEFKRGEKEITYFDLQGFWDMVHYEIEKIHKSFNNLEKCQKNDWVFVQETLQKVEPKKKPKFINTAKVTIDSKARALAARQRLAEAKLRMKAHSSNKCENQTEIAIVLTKNDISEQKSLVAEKIADKESSKKVSGKETVPEKQPQINHALKNIKNVKISEQKEDSPLGSPTKISNSQERINSHHRKQRCDSKMVKKSGKENVSESKNVSDEKLLAAKPVQSKRVKNKEVIPLQCVTRSAKRAMIAESNAKK